MAAEAARLGDPGFEVGVAAGTVVIVAVVAVVESDFGQVDRAMRGLPDERLDLARRIDLLWPSHAASSISW